MGIILKYIFFSAVVHAYIKKEFMFYDSMNPDFILAIGKGELFFIEEEEASTQRVQTLFEVKDGRVRLDHKELCSDGNTGRVFRMCKVFDFSSSWRLEEARENPGIYELRCRDGQKCAVYGSDRGEKRDIDVGTCWGDVVKFKLDLVNLTPGEVDSDSEEDSSDNK